MIRANAIIQRRLVTLGGICFDDPRASEPTTASGFSQRGKPCRAQFQARLDKWLGGSLHRIIPIVLAHHDKFDGSVQHSAGADGIPLEARIISVADVYDALISDRPYRKAMSPLDAKDTLVRGAGSDFDPTVVKAFLKAFQKGELELDYAGLEVLQPTRAV